MGLGGDQDIDPHNRTTPVPLNGERALDASAEAVRVRDLSLPEFRRRLIEHFSFLWSRHEVAWPTRTGIDEWRAP
jgi:hypothetical protein